MRSSSLLLAAILRSTPLRADVTIGGVTYDNVDAGPEFAELVDDIVHRRQDWVPPSPTAAAQAAGRNQMTWSPVRSKPPDERYYAARRHLDRGGIWFAAVDAPMFPITPTELRENTVSR